VLLFDGLAHVALSLGSTRVIRFQGTTPEDMSLHEAMSLWRADSGQNSHFENRRISVEELAVQCATANNRLIGALNGTQEWDQWRQFMRECKVTYAPPPWGG
jgi:hypothetical protein